MGRVAAQQPLASAYVVFHGCHGEVSRYARRRGVCQQRIYREAARVRQVLTHQPGELQRPRTHVRQLQHRQAALERQLSDAVVLDGDKQAELATVAQACGVTLRDCWELLEVLIPGRVLSVATLGRRTQDAGRKAGPALAILAELARPQVRDVAADEIFVKAPVLMVAPESLCWLSGRLSAAVSGTA